MNIQAILIAAVLGVTGISGASSTAVVKGDINGDHVLTEEDLDLFSSCLIGRKQFTE